MKCKDQLRQWWNKCIDDILQGIRNGHTQTYPKLQGLTKPFAKPKLCSYVSDKKASWSREKLSVGAELRSKSVCAERQNKVTGADLNIQMPIKTGLLIFWAPVKLITDAGKPS